MIPSPLLVILSLVRSLRSSQANFCFLHKIALPFRFFIDSFGWHLEELGCFPFPFQLHIYRSIYQLHLWVYHWQLWLPDTMEEPQPHFFLFHLLAFSNLLASIFPLSPFFLFFQKIIWHLFPEQEEFFRVFKKILFLSRSSPCFSAADLAALLPCFGSDLLAFEGSKISFYLTKLNLHKYRFSFFKPLLLVRDLLFVNGYDLVHLQ